MNNKLQKLKSKFKNAKNINQIITGLKQLLVLTKTDSIQANEINLLLNIANNNNYHPNKNFKIKYKDTNPKFWKEYDRLKKYPSRILLDLDRDGEYYDKENHSMAHCRAITYCKKNKLRIYVNKKEEVYTKHYDNAFNKAWDEVWEDTYTAKQKKLFDQRKTVDKIERNILKTYEINQLQKKYGWFYFKYVLEYGEACMKRNGFSIKENCFKKPSQGSFTPIHIEKCKTITIEHNLGNREFEVKLVNQI